MTKADQARELIDKFPKKSKRELGKMLVKLYPDKFKDEEDGRYIIRTVTGSTGEPIGRTIPTHKDIYIGPRLEPGEKYDNSPYILTAKKIGLLYDIHIPFHDRDVLYLALSWLKAQGIDCLILGGDIIDCYDLSKFEKDPSARPFWDEVKMLTDFLDDLRDNFPEIKIIYKLGNHETRYKRYLLRQAIELNIPINSIQYLIKQEITKCEECVGLDCDKCGGVHWIIRNKDRNIIMVGDARPIHAGKLDIIHGHEPRGGAGSVSPARQFMMKRKVNTIGGHFHRASKQPSKDARGSRSAAWSVGCLCDLTPQYMPDNEWGHGFAMVEVEGDMFTVHNKEIMNGRVV